MWRQCCFSFPLIVNVFLLNHFNLMVISKLLPDFDRRVNDNKTAAEEAMKKIPVINATIMAANEKTRQAKEALGNAASDAGEAKRKAEEAEKIAGNIQKVRRRPLLVDGRSDPLCSLTVSSHRVLAGLS